MPEDKGEPSGFKVVDRRSFSVDGTRREHGEEKEPPPRAAAARPAAPLVVEEAEESFEAGPTGFDTLVSYLSTTAMFQLGLLQGPGGETIPADLVSAHRTIDLLTVLQQKTKGNLTQDEARLLDEVLYELRMSYLEVETHFTKKTK